MSEKSNHKKKRYFVLRFILCLIVLQPQMFQAYKNITSSFFIALWAISQMLQLGHEVIHHNLAAHHEGCVHHHHNEVKQLDKSSDFVSLFEDCAICDFEWFNSLENSANLSISNDLITLVPVKLGQTSHALAENWISRSDTPRGPPVKS
jgi:hypothetical protein